MTVKEIKTNYKVGRYEYPMCNGDYKEGWLLKVKNSCRETTKEFYERLVKEGYKRISFYETSTRVKGTHNLIAYVK